MEQTVCADTSYTPFARPSEDDWHCNTNTAYGAWSRCVYRDYTVRCRQYLCGWRLRAYKETRYRPEECLIGDPILIACTTCGGYEREKRSKMNDLRYRLDRAIYISERLEETLGVTGSHVRIEYAWVSEQDLSKEQRRWHDTHPEARTLGQLVLALEAERIPEGWDLDDYTDEIGEMYRRVENAHK